jgi:uncharacterized protein (TIGR03083 family)
MSDAIDPFRAHRRAQATFASVLAGVGQDQLGGSTPCPPWTVRDLLLHVVNGNQGAAGGRARPLPGNSLRGTPQSEPTDWPPSWAAIPAPRNGAGDQLDEGLKSTASVSTVPAVRPGAVW